ncbi:MAG: hypothetical protein V1645_05190 [archaeon]
MKQYKILHLLTEIQRKDPVRYERMKQKAVVIEFFPSSGIWQAEGYKSEYVLLTHNVMIHGRTNLEQNELEQKLRESTLRLMQEGFHISVSKPNQRQHSYRNL